MRRKGWLFMGIAGAMALCALAQASPEKPSDPWSRLQFLIGSWTGTGGGKPGEAISGGTTFAFDLGKNIILRKNRAEYPPKKGEKENAVHEDLMVIYREPQDGKFRAIYFDNEGHVIRYAVSFPDGADSAVFETDPVEKGPRFRLTCLVGKDGLLTVDFSIAPPGGEFKSYTKGVLKRSP